MPKRRLSESITIRSFVLVFFAAVASRLLFLSFQDVLCIRSASSDEIGFGRNTAVEDDYTVRLLREQIMDKAERKTNRIRDLFLEFDENGDGVVSYEVLSLSICDRFVSSC